MLLLLQLRRRLVRPPWPHQRRCGGRCGDWSSPFQPLALALQELLLQACTGALREPAAMHAWCAKFVSQLCPLDADKHVDFVHGGAAVLRLVGNAPHTQQ